MEAWIKYKGDNKNNYTRFGKVIPTIEMKIDICQYFNCDIERAKFIASQLISDSNIECKLQKSASDSVRKMQEELEEKALNKNKFVEEKNKRYENLNKKVAEKIEMTDEKKEEIKKTIEENNG